MTQPYNTGECQCIGDTMRVAFWDLETTTHTLHKRKASPFSPENWVVACGWAVDDSEPTGMYYTTAEGYKPFDFSFLEGVDLVVGVNLKFDLLHSWNNPQLKAWIKAGGRIWDCQIAEYCLEGMKPSSHMMSMDMMCEGYGGTLKDDAVKALWDQGVNTPDIPEDLLMAYLLGNEEEDLAGDINNTRLIYQGQMQKIAKMPKNFLPMLEARHEGLLATTEMEFNGLHVDEERAEHNRVQLASDLDRLGSELQRFIPELPPELEFNWASIYHKSYLIYGGTAKYSKWVQHTDPETGELLYATKTEKWPLYDGRTIAAGRGTCLRLSDGELLCFDVDGTVAVPDVFQSGKRKGETKTKNVKVHDLSKPKGAQQPHYFKFEGFTKGLQKWEGKLSDGAGKPLYSTDADTMDELLATTDIAFIKMLGERNAKAKDLGTYYWTLDKKGNKKGMLTLVGENSKIHGKFNHTSVVTGRLSSSNPNLQNAPRGDTSDVREMFTSRFGDDGVVVEIDYSQLEQVSQAILTQDEQMIADLNNNVDFHCKRLAAMLRESYETVYEKCKVSHDAMYLNGRQQAKAFSFAKNYGAGVIKIMLASGLRKEEVEALFAAEELMYPGITRYDAVMEKAINATKRVTKREVFIKGQRFQLSEGIWDSPFGVRYTFSEHETPEFLHDRGRFVGFSPTERKNYSVQGDSGMFVQMATGYVFRWLAKTNNFDGKALMVATVHDCVIMDVHKSVVDKVVPTVKVIMEAIPTMIKRHFNITVPVKFPCEVEIGPNLKDMTPYG